jgi:putative ABC transport system substrate-binding protein
MLFERRATQGHVDRVLAFMADFIALNVDVIAVVTTGASLAAKSATSKIPLVMLTVSDPVDNGLVNSLARPGGNITGIADLGEELIPKLLELLKAAAPNITRVAFIHEDYSGRMKAAKAQQRSVGRHAAPLSVEPAHARIGLGRRPALLD